MSKKLMVLTLLMALGALFAIAPAPAPAQEVVKLLHGMDALLGRGFVFEGLAHTSYVVTYPKHAECVWHEPPAPIERTPDLDATSSMAQIWEWASQRLGDVDALDFSRELVKDLTCAITVRVRTAETFYQWNGSSSTNYQMYKDP